jgi:transposase InsO family protein
MTQKSDPSTAALWARFRFSVVGPLLSAPPAQGGLKAALGALAAKTWRHPVHGGDVRFAVATIERWYYTARREKDDPVGVLRRTVRKDCGKVSLAAEQIRHLQKQYEDYPHWTYQLHYDNLATAVNAKPDMGRLRSYCTVRRYMQSHGLVRQPRPRPKGRPGEEVAAVRRESREVRSYEAEYVGSLWHLDFHHGSLKVLTSRGQWQRSIALAILDDHSRLCCHLQWYLGETAEDLVHGLSQAIQKRGLPRALLTDNGAAMVAEEVGEGLLRLGILHEKTLPYSPYQNGKQEVFWATLEGRLMQMLDGCAELSLDFLNQASQAWVEMEYHRAVHRETGVSPLQRFAQTADVLRNSPSSEALRDAFRLESKRRQRKSDGTISLEGVRFEVPARYRHFKDVSLRYARWDLGRVDLVDPRNGTILAPLYPQDRTANADARRCYVGPPPQEMPADGKRHKPLPPLLQKLLDEYSATGTPPAYLPKPPASEKGEAQS